MTAHLKAGLVISLLLLSISLIGCAEPEVVLETLPTIPPVTPGPLQTSTPLIQLAGTAPAGATNAVDTSLTIQGATSALALALNVPESSIAFLNLTPQLWPDSSLGCPQPDQAYSQVITPGYLITFRVDEATYEVHSDENQYFVVCLNSSDGVASPTPPDPIVAEFIFQVTQDLATELGVPPDSVVLVSSEAADWSDASLGCEPGRGTQYPPEAISGYRIVLAVGDQYFEYHTSFDSWMLCEEPTQ